MGRIRKEKNKIIMLIICLVVALITIPTINVRANITGNDTPVTAYEITSLPFKAKVEVPQNTTAWFKIELDKETSLNLKYTGRYRYYTIYSEEEIYKDEPQYIIESSYSGDICYKLKPGVYYIQLRSSSGTSIHNVDMEEIQEDSNENNDEWERATNIILGNEYETNISAWNDVDWYKVYIPEKGVLRLSQGINRDLHYEIYSSNNKNEAIYADDDLRVTKGFKLDKGYYYIKLFDYNSSFISEMFKVRFDFYKDEIYENNETPEEAKLLPLDKDVIINLQSMDDEDWFKVEVGDEGATLRLDLYGPEKSYAYMYLYNEEILNNKSAQYIKYNGFGTYYQNPDGSYTDNKAKISYKLNKGIYYVKFIAASLGYNYDEIYDNTMTVRATLVNDEFENNDNRENAKTLKLNSENTIILDRVDEDWFKVDVKEAGILNLDFRYIDNQSGSKDPVLRYEVYKEGQDKIFNNYANSYYSSYTNTNYNCLLDKGIYYIKIDSYYDRTTVSFKNKFTPTNIPYNGDVDNAYEVKIGKQIELISAYGIYSWVKFNVNETQRLEIRSTFYHNYVYTYENGQLNRYSSSDYVPGTYYVKLYSTSAAQGKDNLLIEGDAYNKVPRVQNEWTSGESTYPKITLRFNHVMDIKTLNDETVKLYRNNEEVKINYEFYKDTKELVITPVNRLNYDTTYEVFISDKVRSDETGNKMAYEYSWRFTTSSKPAIPEDPVKEGRLMGYIDLPKELSALSRAAEIVISGEGYKKYLYIDKGKIFDLKLPEGEYEVRVIIPTMLDAYKNVTIKQGYDTSVELAPIEGDINGDSIIDIFDIAKISLNYNMSSE